MRDYECNLDRDCKWELAVVPARATRTAISLSKAKASVALPFRSWAAASMDCKSVGTCEGRAGLPPNSLFSTSRYQCARASLPLFKSTVLVLCTSALVLALVHSCMNTSFVRRGTRTRSRTDLPARSLLSLLWRFSDACHAPRVDLLHFALLSCLLITVLVRLHLFCARTIAVRSRSMCVRATVSNATTRASPSRWHWCWALPHVSYSATLLLVVYKSYVLVLYLNTEESTLSTFYKYRIQGRSQTFIPGGGKR